MPLFTAGYEGSNIEEFVRTICSQGMEVIIDVRQLPLSRKPGFSKSSFSRNIEEAGIDYVHAPIFGCPKYIRDKFKIDKNWAAYEIEFRKYLNNNYQKVIELAGFVENINTCLVCFERDYRACHRSIIADFVENISQSRTIHLIVK